MPNSCLRVYNKVLKKIYQNLCLLPIIYLVIVYFHHSKSKRNSLKIFKSLFILNKSVIVNAFSIGLVLHSTDIDNYYHCRLWPMMIQWWTPLYYPLTLPPWRVLREVSTFEICQTWSPLDVTTLHTVRQILHSQIDQCRECAKNTTSEPNFYFCHWIPLRRHFSCVMKWRWRYFVNDLWIETWYQ